LSYEWQNVNSNFKMPVDIVVNDKTIRLHPTSTKQETKIDKKIELEKIQVQSNKFFIKVEKKQKNNT
jgi:hypothetical protein